MFRCEFFITLHNFLRTPFTFDSARQAQHLRIRSLLPFGGQLQTFNETALSGGSDDDDIDDVNPSCNGGNYTHGHKRRRVDGGDGSSRPTRLQLGGNQGPGGGGVTVDGLSSLTEELTTLNVQAIRLIRKVRGLLILLLAAYCLSAYCLLHLQW